MQPGSVVLILHTHLPYVLHHGTWPHGSDWLCEAVAECYIPLLNVIEQLAAEGLSAPVTVDISPVLCEQLEHPDFPPLFEQYCTAHAELARNDERYFRRTESNPHYQRLARLWQSWYQARLQDFRERYSSSIIGALRRLQEAGAIEVMTCAATHGYLPLLGSDASVALQVLLARDNYRKHFGTDPQGIWLPECAYRPAYPWRTYLNVEYFSVPHARVGVEQVLARAGLEYFVTDEPLLRRAVPLAIQQEDGTLAPPIPSADHPFALTPLELYRVASCIETATENVAVFTRDQRIALQVWSADMGYPGDPNYLDFHKKHFSSALRYWRVTDNKADMRYKLLYVPQWAEQRAQLHAFHFTQLIERSLAEYHRTTGRRGVLCLPFDTELFGHWWFEGPQFLYHLLRGLAHSPLARAQTASAAYAQFRPQEVIQLPEGSWGRGNHHDVWIEPSVHWMWEAIYRAEHQWMLLAERVSQQRRTPTLERILAQTLRELLLLQASDWEFLVTTHSAGDYAHMRFFFHHSDFERLCQIAERYLAARRLSAADRAFLHETEQRNAIFPELRFDHWLVASHHCSPAHAHPA
ncbi:MAG: 1,4-alpha-glucan-branching protein [Candidatus Kapaibacterium sp.]|nr:MAG: 1,4-alpha-glucan-branching protein [Candidatus Kapabacteria bacterium]